MSERQKQHSTDEARGRYWHQMLNMADDDLDPYAYRLLGHYIRVDGCWETVRTTALVTRMSVGKVVKTRNALQDSGWINVELSEHDTYLITVIDRMKENVERYEKLAREKKARSRGEHALNGVHEVNNDVHVVKNRKFKRVHEVKQRRTEEPTEEEKESYASASAAHAQWPSNLQTSTPSIAQNAEIVSLEGTERSARAENSTRKSRSATTTTTPPPTPSPSTGKPVADRPAQKSILAWIIDDAWAGKIGERNAPVGMSARLTPVLMGTSKKHDCVTPKATEEEIFAFVRWYRAAYPHTPLPMEAKVASWIGQFRASNEYDMRRRTARDLVAKIYHAAPAPVVPVDEKRIAADDPLWDTIAAFTRQTVFGGEK